MYQGQKAGKIISLFLPSFLSVKNKNKPRSSKGFLLVADDKL